MYILKLFNVYIYKMNVYFGIDYLNI